MSVQLEVLGSVQETTVDQRAMDLATVLFDLYEKGIPLDCILLPGLSQETGFEPHYRAAQILVEREVGLSEAVHQKLRQFA